MEGRQAVDWATGAYIFSPSLLSDAPVTRDTEDQTGTPLQTVSVGCSAEKVTMLLCIWLTPASGSQLSRPFEEGKLACSRKPGWLQRGGGDVSMPKGPRGLPAMGFACLG